MRVMTFNLLFDNHRDRDFQWQARRGLVLRIIRRYAPHIVGTQEGMIHQLEYLRRELAPDYAMIAEGRTWDESSQYPTLFYRTDALALLDAGESWLSMTPCRHLSMDWDSGFPRMMNHGTFKEHSTGRELIALVTHLDHVSNKARLEQAKLISRWLAPRSEPAIVLGDFNDWPGSPVHRVLTAGYREMIDTWQALCREEGEQSMTRHDRAGNPRKYRMDWILHSPDFLVSDASILRDNENGLYPSDHYPYLAELEWKDGH